MCWLISSPISLIAHLTEARIFDPTAIFFLWNNVDSYTYLSFQKMSSLCIKILSDTLILLLFAIKVCIGYLNNYPNTSSIPTLVRLCRAYMIYSKCSTEEWLLQEDKIYRQLFVLCLLFISFTMANPRNWATKLKQWYPCRHESHVRIMITELYLWMRTKDHQLVPPRNLLTSNLNIYYSRESFRS